MHRCNHLDIQVCGVSHPVTGSSAGMELGIDGRGQIPKSNQSSYRCPSMGLPRRCLSGPVRSTERSTTCKPHGIHSWEQRNIYISISISILFRHPLGHVNRNPITSVRRAEQPFKYQHPRDNRRHSRGRDRPRSSRCAGRLPAQAGRKQEEQTPTTLSGVCASDGNPRRRGRGRVPLRLAPGEPARERDDERQLELEPRARLPRAVACVPARVRGWRALEPAATVRDALGRREPAERAEPGLDAQLQSWRRRETGWQ